MSAEPHTVVDSVAPSAGMRSALAHLKSLRLLAQTPIAQETVLPWLIQLRWGAVAGQLITVLLAASLLHMALPLAELLTIIGITAGYNIIITVWARRNLRAYILPAVFILDMLALTGLLYLTGGPSNPFAVFYIVHVILAAVVLRGAWTWLMAMMTALGYGFLFWRHIPLPPPSPPYAQLWPFWQLLGSWVALVLVAVLLAYFINKVLAALHEQERQLAAMQAVSAKNARLASLTTLAAGAAHELNTPLGVIKIAVTELDRTLKRRFGAETEFEDVHLIRSEIERCRSILDRMHIKALDEAEHRRETLSLSDLYAAVRAQLGDADAARVDMRHSPDLTTIAIPRIALTQALVALLTNALHASPDNRPVRLTVERERRSGALRFVVEDTGAGMSPEVLTRAGEPFFTTKRTGEGKRPGEGMGLGLFLVQVTAERLGGRMALTSTPGQGTRVVVEIPDA